MKSNVIIIGAGIGGLTLALELHQKGVPCVVFEAVKDMQPLGVGINILPHAMGELALLGVEDQLVDISVPTVEAAFCNRFGQMIYREPLGKAAGYKHPQLSIHRGDLQMTLLAAVRERLGPDAVHIDRRCTGFEQDANGVTAHFETFDGEAASSVRGEALVACDGIRSAIRKQLFPDEGPLRYSGLTGWRGVTRMQPFLTGATFLRAGWFPTGKIIVYPIRSDIDEMGNQLVNWATEVEMPPRFIERNWTRVGDIADFIDYFEEMTFDFLDIPAMIRKSEIVYEFSMVDQEPLTRWTFDRVTLLGDAAHPMLPRGSNGAGQAILDARALGDLLAETDAPHALRLYESKRIEATGNVVRTNRTSPPDAILGVVYDRTHDHPFERIDDVISADEIKQMSDDYKRVAQYDLASLS